MEDLHAVCQSLSDLSPPLVIELGLTLGLKYPRLQGMTNVPQDMVASWLRQEDMVPKQPPTWTTLITALESIGQTGMARDIESQYCP